jgi:cell division septal protein FtsQ
MAKKDEHTEPRGLPSIPGIVGIFVILAAAVAGGLYWNRTGKVERIQYKGLHYVSQKELNNQIHIPLDISPDSLNLTKIRQQIEEIPYVKYVRFNMRPGGTMMIDITERTPIALLINGSQRAYVDADGVYLPQLPGKVPDVPILYGFPVKSGKDTLQSRAFKQAYLFLENLHQKKASDATISEIVWTEKQGIIALTNNNGVKLVFGKNDFAKRLRNWEAFYREIVRKEGIDQIHSVDLRFKGQIVTKEG